MNALVSRIDSAIDRQHLLNHRFYKAWSKGELDRDVLRDYAEQYYRHVKAFPTYLSLLHAHTEDMETRIELLKNLWEEEGGSPNHPDLWRAFALRLGSRDETLDTGEASSAITALIESFRTICGQGSVADGLAALYAYESQIPAVSESKIEGLKEFYGMRNPEDWTYFTVHIEADKEHAAVERRLLEKHLTDRNVVAAEAAAQQVLDKLYGFLDSLCEKHQIACVA